MGATVIQRSFAAGELAPGIYARADLKHYLEGLRTCRNFIVQRHGGATNRPGSAYVATAKATGAHTFIYPFIYPAADQSFLIEAGENYFRFHHHGSPVLVSGVVAWSNVTAYVAGDLASRLGVNYYCVLAHTNVQPPNVTHWYPLAGAVLEIPTPYNAGIFQPPAPLCWSQSGLRVSLTHMNQPPLELIYQGPQRWVLQAVTTGPLIAIPANPVAVAGAAGLRTFAYIVTAVDALTREESNPSAVATVATCAEPTVDTPNAISWDAVAGAGEYNIYTDPFENGTFGYIGTATALTTFFDTGEFPDFGLTAPIPRVLFASTFNYPAVSVVHNQRRIYGGTANDREITHASRVGMRANFGIRSPLQDDDALTWNIASQRLQPIIHLVGLKDLIVLTDQGEWVVHGDRDTGALLPQSINPEQHGYVGSAFTAPVTIGNSILFVQARGNVLRSLAFDRDVEGLSGADLTVLAGHLFRGSTIVDMDYALVPDSVVWCVRSDGVLLGLTFMEGEDVWGWSRHDTDGLYEQVVVLPEGQEDAVYVVVMREIGGVERRFIERFRTRTYTDLADAFFVDSGVTHDGAATTAITGLSHLNGKTVRAFADGLPVPGSFVVASGSITLPAARSVVHVGLPITAELETLDLDIAGDAVRDKRKHVVALSLLVEASMLGAAIGPDAAHLKTLRAPRWNPATLFSDKVEINTAGAFTDRGRMLIRHTDPSPLTVLAVLPHVDVGG
jgi:hypothetical protein